jgi:hypothetical protein
MPKQLIIKNELNIINQPNNIKIVDNSMQDQKIKLKPKPLKNIFAKSEFSNSKMFNSNGSKRLHDAQNLQGKLLHNRINFEDRSGVHKNMISNPNYGRNQSKYNPEV